MIFGTICFILLMLGQLSYGSISSNIYYEGYNEDIADKKTLWTGGPDYMHDLFYQLSFAFPAKQGSRRPVYIDAAILHKIDANRPMKPAMCRLTDFIHECNHDYEGLSNIDGGNDNNRPFFNDFAVTDKAISETKFILYPDLQYLPALGVSITPIHSVAGFNARNGDPLVLTRQVLARIFRGNITSWNHADIIATNPLHISHLNAAGEIGIVVHGSFNVLTEVFKKSLGAFDTTFASQIGTSGDPIWNGVPTDRLTFREADTGTISHLKLTPDAVGYVTLSEALKNNMEYIAILPNGYTSLDQAVIPDSTSTEFAISDQGLDFGNDGNNPIRMTANLYNPHSSHAWPIVSYVYFGIRKNSLRPGADCNTRQDVFDFINWFYSDFAAQSILRKFGFSPLPTHIESIILSEFRNIFMCNNEKVYNPNNQKSIVDILSINELTGAFDILQESFLRIKETVILNNKINDAHIIQNIGITEIVDTKPYVAFAKKSNLLLFQAIANNKNLQKIPYAGIALGIVYNLCGAENRGSCLYSETQIKLDMNTVNKIFDGDIKFWDDTSIIAQNENINIPHLPIVVVKPSKSEYYTLFDQVMRSINNAFGYKGATIKVENDDEALTKVFETSGSVTFYPMHGSLKALGKTALIKNINGNYVSPTSLNILSCGNDTYNITTGMFNLISSKDPNCYPISEEIYIISPIHYSQCSDDVKATVEFLQWIVNGFGDAAHNHDIIHNPIRNKTVLETAVDVSLALINNNMAPLFSANVNSTLPGYRIDGSSAMLKVVENLENIRCSGKQMLMNHADLKLISNELIIGIFAITGFAISSIIGLAIWTMVNRKKRLVRNSSPMFMFQILFGAAIALLAIFPMGMQDSNFSFHDPELNKNGKRLDMACQASPFLYSLGFGISFSSLFVKTWRMIKLFNNRRFKRLQITDWMLVKYQIAIVGFIILFNAIWISLDPLVWKRIPLATNDAGNVIISTGICAMNNDVYIALGPLLGIMISLLIIGNYLSYQARNIPSEYSESKWISFSMILYLEALVLGVPVVILSVGNASSSFLVRSVAILIADYGTVLLIFLPKIWLLYGWGIDGQSSLNKEKSTGESGSKTDKKGTKNSKTNSRENIVSTHPAGVTIQSISDVKSNVVTINPMPQASLTDITGSSYGVSSKSQVDIKIKSAKQKQLESEIPVEIESKVYPSIVEALQNESVRQFLIEFAAPQLFDEPIRFYSDVVDFQATKNSEIRAKKAIVIIKRYILADSPLELCIPSPLRHKYERLLAIREQGALASNKAPRNKSHGFFGGFFSSAIATVPSQLESDSIRKDDNSKTVSGENKVSSTEELSDIDIFQPIQKLVAFSIHGDRKRWKPAIVFLENMTYLKKDQIDTAEVSLDKEIVKENPSHLSLA